MGNCQAAEAATVVIQHPGNKVERIYWSVSAHEVMSSNPGHYVALVVMSSPAARTGNGAPVTQVKLLRPDDTLLMGQVYRLISFEDVLKEFAAKKCVKLGKLLKERGMGMAMDKKKRDSALHHPRSSTGTSTNKLECRVGSSGSRSMGRNHGGGQWKPALQSISEVGN